MSNSLAILTVLALVIAASEWLSRRGVFRHVGSALLVILLTAVVANAGLIPAGSTDAAPVPVYDVTFSAVAPIALFWLLLSVNLRDVLEAGGPLIGLFLLGSAGAMLGAVIGMKVVNGRDTIGPLYHGVAGMFTGTYIGGSVNFNAVALEYGVIRDPTLYTGAVVVDNIVTTVWMAVTLLAPRLLARFWSRARPEETSAVAASAPIVDLPSETETLTPMTFAAVAALGIAALVVSQWISDACAAVNFSFPTILVITTLALILAQVPAVTRMAGPRLLGMVGVYLFLAVIGAFCDLRTMPALGRLGFVLLTFASVLVAVHGLVLYGGAWIFRMDLNRASLASQANVGGSTSALALAKSLGREDLLVPGILLGALGNAIGTFLGFWVASWT